MDESLTLISWTSDVDPGSGEFTFKQYTEESGHYVISKRPGLLDYWRSWMTGGFLSFDEMHQHFEVANLLSNFSRRQCSNYYRRCLPEADSYKRLVMKRTGELQYLKRDVDSGNWFLEW